MIITESSPQVKIARLDLKIDKVDLHRHLEGSLFVTTIIELAQQFQVPFEEATIRTMNQVVEHGLREKSLSNFINLLSTRWMKLLVTKLMVENDAPTSKNLVRSCIDAFLEKVITHAQDGEQLEVINLLISPLNLSINGDLAAAEQTNGYHKTAEEKKYETLWAEKIQTSDITDEGVTWQEYLNSIGKTRKRYEQKNGKRIYITCALRRDKDFDFLTNEQTMLDRVHDLHSSFQNAEFDFIDICGNEANPAYLLKNFSTFLNLLSYFHIPFTVHLAELKYNSSVKDQFRYQRNTAYLNIGTALNHLDSKPVIAAHAVRITDQIATVQKLFTSLRQAAIPIALNVSSNIMTGLFPKEDAHRLVQFLLNHENESSIKEVLMMICTDDPVITDKKPGLALGKEVQTILDIVGKVSRRFGRQMMQTTFIEMLEHKLQLVVSQLENLVMEKRQASMKVKQLSSEEFRREIWRNAKDEEETQPSISPTERRTLQQRALV